MTYRHISRSLACQVIFSIAIIWAGQLEAQPIPPDAVAGVDTRSLKKLNVGDAASLPDLLHYSDQPLPIVSAHRGGPMVGYPENCLATFEHTLLHTYALMEVDPRLTKDGQIVLHHDARLERTTTGTGLVAQRTLAELQRLQLKDSAGHITNNSIPTLDEAIQWARGKAILVLDQKDVPIEMRVKAITERQAERHVMVIVYSFKDAKKCYELNNRIMMEVMVPNQEQLQLFDETGVSWKNVVAFVGHDPPTDPSLFDEIHKRGSLCMAGTSRNLDRQVLAGAVPSIEKLHDEYKQLLSVGVNLIETDIPTQLGPLLFEQAVVVGPASRFFATLPR